MQNLMIRAVNEADYEKWLLLWHGYNAFYGRAGETALAANITATTWARFFDANEPVFAYVAEADGALVGLAHYLFHRSTTRVELTCYLQDLYTAESLRGQGIGRRLIEAVYEAARREGIKRVYWQTHETNSAGRKLYDTMAKNAGFIIYSQELV
jgi:GNAT superfamily N-acetyltransferase